MTEYRLPVLSRCFYLLIAAASIASIAPLREAGASELRSGMVCALAGDVLVTRSSGQVVPTEGFVLQEGDTLWAKAGGICRGFTPEGESFSLDGPAQLVFAAARAGGGGPGITGWVSQVLSQWVGESRRRPLTTRSVRSWEESQDACTPIAPASDGKVRSKNAIFYWTTIPGVDSYLLTIAPARGAEETHMVRGYSYTQSALEPGGEYVWRIAPVIQGADLQGRWRAFRVLTADEERSMEAAIRGKTDLEAGVLLLCSGLHAEAVDRFDAAVGGDDRRSALRWRAEAFSAMGQYGSAYSDILQTITKP
jgi:hypothetical protein